ncbi:MAG TPA: phosphoribosylanthranilate isomerase [Gemmatimonadaceae bacterium]
MRVEVKFCGLTRPADARAAAELGARYLGVIFAGGPRNLEPSRAREVLDGAGTGNEVERVGVFGRTSPAAIAATVRQARLDVVQLHADPTVDEIRAVGEVSGARVWAVVRVDGTLVRGDLDDIWEASEALVLDSKSRGSLGGSGISFDWGSAQRALRPHAAKLVVAGGLTSANVAQAIESLSPDVVDVSSGVESSPGIKDHTRMADFMDAVRRAGVLR